MHLVLFPVGHWEVEGKVGEKEAKEYNLTTNFQQNVDQNYDKIFNYMLLLMHFAGGLYMWGSFESEKKSLLWRNFVLRIANCAIEEGGEKI